MKNAFKALVAICAMSIWSGVSAGVLSLMNPLFFHETSDGGVDLNTGAQLFEPYERFNMSVRLLIDGVEAVEPDATLTATATLISGVTQTYAMQSTAPYHENDPFLASYWTTLVDFTDELADATWQMNASLPSNTDGILFIDSWSDALSQLDPGLDPLNSAVPTPEILFFEASSLDVNLSWNSVTDLEPYDGSLDAWRTRIVEVQDGGSTVKIADSGRFSLSQLNYQFDINLDPGTYYVDLELDDTLGVANGTFHKSRGRTRVQFTVEAPEPTTTALLALGLFGAGLGFRRRRVSRSL